MEQQVVFCDPNKPTIYHTPDTTYKIMPMSETEDEGGHGTIEPLTAEIRFGTSQTYTPDEGVDGFNPVNITATAPVLESKTVNINQPGTTTITPSSDYDALSSVSVNCTYYSLESKEVTYTQNGNYTILPSSTYGGITNCNVHVQVPTSNYPVNDSYYITNITTNGQENSYISFDNLPAKIIPISTSQQLNGGCFIKMNSSLQILQIYQSNRTPTVQMNDGTWYLVTNRNSDSTNPEPGLLYIRTTDNNNISSEFNSRCNESIIEFPELYLTALLNIN